MRTTLMLALLLTGSALFEAASASPAVTGEAPAATKPAQIRKVVVPGTTHEVAFGRPSRGDAGVAPTPALMKAILTWLGKTFDLPRGVSLPAVKFASPASITTFRHTGILSDRPDDVAAVPPGQREVVAAYDPVMATIYLPERWTGGSPAELSMLVHEMVHHVQHETRMRYECPQASEELAYAAQDKWLHLFGRDLATDFETDPFTLLVSVRCAY